VSGTDFSTAVFKHISSHEITGVPAILPSDWVLLHGQLLSTTPRSIRVSGRAGANVAVDTVTNELYVGTLSGSVAEISGKTKKEIATIKPRYTDERPA
jgi:hypothetical protein